MGLTLDTNSAKQADNKSSVISEAGKFVGTLTRAEKLLSEKGTQGVGFSFKSDDGATANYLDIYTVNNKGEALPGLNIVNAILACTSTRNADEDEVEVERWDKQSKSTYKAKSVGYPSLIGKRIGFLFQKELQTSDKGTDVERIVIYAVFNAENNLTASEILEKKTQSTVLAKLENQLASRPVIDRRKKTASNNSRPSSDSYFDDDPGF